MIITIEEFANYNNLQYDITEEAIIQDIIDYGTSVVTNYLRFDPDNKSHTITLDGYGTYFISLPYKPITLINSIKVDGVELDLDQFRIRENHIVQKDRVAIFTDGLDNVEVNCEAGFVEIPKDIKGVTLEIASLIWSNKGQNIGVTSKADEFGNKTFINYNNFDKYLNRISQHRILF